MKHPVRMLSVALIAVGPLTACGTDDMHDQDATAMRAEIAAARDEVGRHHDVVIAAPALTELAAEMGRHDQQMAAVRSRMNAAMGGMMSRCGGAAMDRMHEMLGNMASEMQSHRDGVSRAATLDAARAQCMDHKDVVTGMLDSMHESLRNVGCMGMHGYEG